MIIRILGEGQRELADQHVAELNRLDDALAEAVNAGDEAAYRDSLAALLHRVRDLGSRLPDEMLVPSDAILPGEASSLAEVRALLGQQGLIPG